LAKACSAGDTEDDVVVKEERIVARVGVFGIEVDERSELIRAYL